MERKIEKIKKEINNILSLKDESIDVILDSYEIEIECYEFINSRDETWLAMFYKILEISLKEKNNIQETIKELKAYEENNMKYQSFIKYIERELKKEYMINETNEKEILEESEKNEEKLEEILDEELKKNNTIEINQEELQKFKGFRENQKIARENNIKQNFSSGIHNQVTGAGKSLILLLTINDHNKKEKKNNKGKLYIITCPRVEVLQNMFFKKDNNEKYVLNEKNIKFWKENCIIDLTKYNIIDRINNKEREIKIDKKKSNILIVNTDYLKILDKSNKIKYDKVKLLLFDECHGVSAEKFYELLDKIKYEKKINIIGFSATPVRENAEEKVKQIFSSSLEKKENPKLNIISNYDLINAIRDEVILPPSYTIVEIKRTCKKKIGKSNKDITEKIIKNKLKILPYKKIICWCRTIAKLKEWYIFFKNRFPELKLYCSTSKDKENKEMNTDFDKFCEAESNSILLCVNRCKEGSDIKNLDCGIFLDYVKKRSILISIQTVGRILRPDIKKLKKNGHIIDTFINDGKIEIEVLTAQKVLSYYEKILGMTGDENCKGMIETYKKIKKMCDETEYDDITKKIKIKIDDDKKHDTEIKLELTTKIFNWSNIKNKLENIIDDNFGINKEQKFNLIIEKLKKTNNFDVEKDFWKVYNKLDFKKLNLPEKKELFEEFKDFFDNKSWFEIMNFDISKYYKTIKHCINAIFNLLDKFDGELITSEIYETLRIYDKKLPPFPHEYFKKQNFTTIEKEFKLNYHEFIDDLLV